MIVKSDIMNPYQAEQVTIKEAVEESFRIASLGYESPEQYTQSCVDQLALMFGILLENLHAKKVLNEQEVVNILATHTIEKED